jgi:hypothetical protein
MKNTPVSRVRYLRNGGRYTLRVDGHLVASSLSKKEAAYHKRRILREMANGTYKELGNEKSD